jgi:ubiquinone biosynthesis protein
MRPRHFGRYREIALVLSKYRLGELMRTLGMERFLPFRWVPPGNPWHKDAYSRSQRTRMALEELGTTFVKVGQILSTRNDVLPPDYVEELTKLQDSLTPLPLEVVEGVIAGEFGKPAREVFASLEPKPLGVASIGQVHAATLADGSEVVVKVQKPGVREQVNVDLEILRQLAASAAKGGGQWREYDLPGLVEEIGDTLTGELDYVREGNSAEHFARFFNGDTSVRVPKVFWDYTTPRVITLERIRGISILDLAALDRAGIDRKELAKRCAGIWTKMVLENEVFHADPHPGNLFVEPDGRLGLVDFGMIGVVDDEVRNNVANVIKGTLDRDVDLILDSFVDMGAITPAGSKERLRKDLKHIFGHYPVLNENLNLNYDLGELLNIVRRNRVQLPGNTFLLLKTMIMAQSLGQRLDPDFDFVAFLAPRVDSLVKKRYRPSAVFRRLPPAIAELALLGVGLPGRLGRILKSVERGELQVRADVSGVERHLEHLERIVNRAVIGVIVAAVMLALAAVFLAYRIGAPR